MEKRCLERKKINVMIFELFSSVKKGANIIAFYVIYRN